MLLGWGDFCGSLGCHDHAAHPELQPAPGRLTLRWSNPATLFFLPMGVIKWLVPQWLPSLPSSPSWQAWWLIQTGFPPGGALESANTHLSRAKSFRAHSGRAAVTADANMLILRVATQPKALYTYRHPLHTRRAEGRSLWVPGASSDPITLGSRLRWPKPWGRASSSSGQLC